MNGMMLLKERKWSTVLLAVFFLSCFFWPADLLALENGPMYEVNAFDDPELLYLLETAAQYNPNISAVAERINQTKEDLKRAVSELAPDVAIGGTARANNEELYGRGKEETNAFVSLSQTLYSGGSLTANKKAAKMALSAQIAEGTRAYQEVMHNVRNAYFECLRAMAQVQVAEESLTLSKEHLRQAEALFRGGMAPKGDVLRVKVSVNQSELDMVTAQSNLDVGWTALEHAVGTRLDRSKALEFTPQEKIDELSPPAYEIPADFLDRALSQRAEILAYRAHIERADYLIRAARGQKSPSVSLSGRWNSDEDASSLTNGEWYVQLDMQLMLYDGGEASSNIRKAQATARELESQIESLESQIKQETAAAEIKLRAAFTRKNLAYEQMATSQEDYRIALRRYDAQMGTNLDVLDARRELINSRTQYVNAVYDIASAQVGLIYALGDDMPPENLLNDKR